jgi:hypothetical protein
MGNMGKKHGKKKNKKRGDNLEDWIDPQLMSFLGYPGYVVFHESIGWINGLMAEFTKRFSKHPWLKGFSIGSIHRASLSSEGVVKIWYWNIFSVYIYMYILYRYRYLGYLMPGLLQETIPWTLSVHLRGKHTKRSRHRARCQPLADTKWYIDR